MHTYKHENVLLYPTNSLQNQDVANSYIYTHTRAKNYLYVI